MQALSPSVFPCYAPADRQTAEAMAAFLERCGELRVYLDEGELRPGEDLVSKARDGRMADVVLVLFSRHSLPRPWPRSEWEDALINEPVEEETRIGFVRCDDCVPPRVLIPQIDLAGLPTRNLRALKRWLRHRESTYRPSGHEADLEVLGIALADRPGSETVADPALAAEFSLSFRDDFEEVVRLECGDRSLAALAGDLGAQLGLRLEGDVASNLSRLEEFCSARRLLLVLEGVGSGHGREFAFEGRCSTLLVEGGVFESGGDPLREVQRAFRHPGFDVGWEELCAMARQGRRLCGEQGRVAESYELMGQWHEAAQERDDRVVLEESSREIVWILESWGRSSEAQRLDYQRATEFARQMMFPW